MIHYSEFAARRASPLPLFGAVASLAAIAICLGDPQAGVGLASAAQVPLLNAPAISAPERWNDENSYGAGGPPFDYAVSDADAWWMNSPEHRDNILGAHFRQVGFGTAVDGEKMYISAVFTD